MKMIISNERKCDHLDFQRVIDRQDHVDILSDEFHLVDQLKYSKKKRSKRKSRSKGKSNEIETTEDESLTCLRCSSRRTDPGYSSGQSMIFTQMTNETLYFFIFRS